MHKVVGKMKQMLSFLFAKNSVGSPFSLESNKTYKGKFSKTIERVKEQNLSLPLEFHYEEPTRIGERFYFRLWDKRSFILHHEEQFPETIVKQAQKRKLTYSEKITIIS